MTNQRSMEMLAFIFASWTFAYKRLPQGPSRSVSPFLSFIREYYDPDVKVDQCAQNVDDIGFASIRAIFGCIHTAGLKLTIEKSHFGVRQVEFLGRTFSMEGVSTQTHKIQNFLKQMRFPQSRKTMRRYLRSVSYYKIFFLGMAKKINPFYKLLKAEISINITSELKETFDSVNKAHRDESELEIEQLLSRNQLVVITDEGFASAGISLSIEENPEQKVQYKKDVLAYSVLSKNLLPCWAKKVPPLETILGFLHGISRFCKQFVGNSKPDNLLIRQQNSQTYLSNKSYSTIAVESMRFCIAFHLQNSTCHQLSQ